MIYWKFSGFIIKKEGIVVTNNHVIEGAEDIFVSVNGSKEYKAKIIGADPYMDLAVLEIDSDEKFLPVNFGIACCNFCQNYRFEYNPHRC